MKNANTLLAPAKLKALHAEKVETWTRDQFQLERVTTDLGSKLWFVFVNGEFDKCFQRMSKETKEWFGVK